MGQKKVALSMRGGGARCSGYLGVIKAMEENEIKIDMIMGSSMGAVIAVLYGFGFSVEEMLEISDEIQISKLFSLEGIRNRTLLGHTKIKEILEKYLGEADLKDSSIPVYIQVTNLNTWKSEILKEGSAVKALQATMSYPFLFPPFHYDDKVLIDGDIASGFDNSTLKSYGAEFVIGLSHGVEFSEQYVDDLYHRFLDPLSIAYHTIQRMDLQSDPVDFLFDNLGKDVGLLDFDRTKELSDYGYQMAQKEITVLKQKVQFSRWENLRTLLIGR